MVTIVFDWLVQMLELAIDLQHPCLPILHLQTSSNNYMRLLTASVHISPLSLH